MNLTTIGMTGMKLTTTGMILTIIAHVMSIPDLHHMDAIIIGGHNISAPSAGRRRGPRRHRVLVSGGGISQPVLQNAWIMFGELSGGTLATAQQGVTSRTCAICRESNNLLVADLGCKHAACERCWRWWVTQFPRGRLDSDSCWNSIPGTIPCFMPGCPCKVGIPARARASLAAEKHKQVGSMCALCCETNRLLLQNLGCSCMACAICWRRWVNTKLGDCRMRRQHDRVPCFTPGCCETICQTLLRRTCATSVKGSDLICELAVRRRLQSNTVYPAESQVDCPRLGCLGLGYLRIRCKHEYGGQLWLPTLSGERVRPAASTASGSPSSKTGEGDQ